MLIRLLSMRKSQIVKKLLLATFLTVFLFLIFANVGFAQDATDPFGLAEAGDIGLPSGDFRVTIVRAIQWLLGFLGLLAVIMILYGGFVWMTSGGDPAKIEKAKKILINTVIGIIIILSAYTITAFIINSLLGISGPGGSGQGGGGTDDLGRWGIGVGPIESVYPEPLQRDVPINTIVAVTFKEEINPVTVCGASDCDGATEMTNIEICHIDDSGVCLADSDFNTDTFIGSKVISNDNRTFTIIPANFLGAEDFQNRKFKVVLKSGIETLAESGKSVFSNLTGNEFAWQFTTNGEMDIDPPEIIDMKGVYPYPDDFSDEYGIATQPTATKFQFTSFTAIEEVLASFDSSATPSADTLTTVTISGNYGGKGTGEVTVRIDSTTGEVITNWPDGMEEFNAGSYGGGALLNIGPYGIILKLNGVGQRGDQWTFNVTAYSPGDKIEILRSGDVIKTYIFGTDIETPTNYINEIVSDSDLFLSCGSDCLQTKATGASTAIYDIRFVRADGTDGEVEKTAGQDMTIGRVVNGVFDAYRNSIIQINFNEAINPATIANSIAVYRDDALLVNNNDYIIEISNQYKTVELVATDACGVNSCGEQIFCWPVDGDFQKYEVIIKAAPLVDANDPRCALWGGADDGHNRCFKNINGNDVFYPFSISTDGVVDMSLNSFNGSFNTYSDDGDSLGIAEGQSGSVAGGSGRPVYNLNNGIIIDDDNKVISYGQSTPIYDGDGFGDNFSWSFYISSEIDNKAPLITTVLPLGDEVIADDSANVEFVFDRLMRSSTLKPGWNYGSTAKEKSERYLILETVNTVALPIGYWASKVDDDINSDGWADITKGILKHHDFDLYVKYSPLAGSGIQSITQNCYLPSAGPTEGAKNGQECKYENGVLSVDCSQVNSSNPASYGYLNCDEISGTNVCNAGQECKVLYYNEDDEETDLGGSWVITKDYPSVGNSVTAGCCFGVCVD